MIIICKDCGDLLQKLFSPGKDGFFNKTKKMFNKVLLKKNLEKGSENKKKEFLSVKFDLLDKDERRKYCKYLKGNIIISHCKGHGCIILLFDFEHFEANRLPLLSRNFFCR